jgi:hypothetical protein
MCVKNAVEKLIDYIQFLESSMNRFDNKILSFDRLLNARMDKSQRELDRKIEDSLHKVENLDILARE